MLDAQITKSLLDGMFRQIREVAELQRKLTEEMVVLHNRIGIVLDLAFSELKVLNYEMSSGSNVL